MLSQEEFAEKLFAELFKVYRLVVPYVDTYEQLLREHGGDGSFRNDHVAFRTIARGQPLDGINAMAPLFKALGYTLGGSLEFPDDHLFAQFFYPPVNDLQLPKVFISELQAWQLDWTAQRIIAETMESERSGGITEILTAIQSGEATRIHLDQLLQWFTFLPWDFPLRDSITILREDTQYGVWVLLFGRKPNHFTAAIDSNHPLGDIEQTVACLLAAGVPMKSVIEGKRSARLRQTSTQAVPRVVHVFDGEQLGDMVTPYAYFEFAQRGFLVDTITGQPVRFEGFEASNARALFGMTVLS